MSMTPAYAMCRPYRDAQDRLLCRQDLSRTYLAHLELEANSLFLLLLCCVQGIHGQLLMRSLRGLQSAEYSLDASALPITVREAAFVEAADCFAALIAKPEVTC